MAKRLVLTRAASAAAARGHPWVYREGLVMKGAPPAHGSLVTIESDDKKLEALALFDASSPIAARVLGPVASQGDVASIYAGRALRSIAARDALSDASTNAYRMVNGEGDRAPGLVVDRYANVAVVKLDTTALEPHLASILERIGPALEARGVTSVALRTSGDGTAGASKIETLSGARVKDRVEIVERGVRMIVDLARGQKTGAFLDQRENRARVRAAARGDALNLFSYAGGFSVNAALGGARVVTSVDIATQAHKTAQDTFRLNGLDPSRHAFVSADVFAFLDGAKKRGAKWDVVISDPPSFAPNERSKDRALAAYRKLHAAARAVLADGGLFFAASCSSHVTMEDFLSTLDDRAIGEGLSVRATFGQPEDHPTLAAWPEGRYLKLVVLS